MKRLLLLVVSVTLSMGIAAQDIVSSQLESIHAYMLSTESRQTHDAQFDYLHYNESSEWYLQLESGIDYTFVAVCDEDCQDLDLKLFDEDGVLLVEDIGPDDVPVLETLIQQEGRYRIQVDMGHCYLEPCKLGLVIYGK